MPRTQRRPQIIFHSLLIWNGLKRGDDSHTIGLHRYTSQWRACHKKERLIARGRSITIYSLLALVVVIAGAALTLYSAHLSIQRWATSGKKFPLGEWWQVDLKAGKSLVYYESPLEIPVNFITLNVLDANSRAMGVFLTGGTNDFLVDGTNGAAVFEIEIDAPGSFQIICNDAAASSIHSVPEADRIVFEKSPNSKVEALGRRRTIQMVGAGITLGLALLLYIIHGIAVGRSNRPPPRRRFVAEIGVPEL